MSFYKKKSAETQVLHVSQVFVRDVSNFRSAQKIREAGFTFELDQDDLVIQPFSKLTANQIKLLKANKAFLVEELHNEIRAANDPHLAKEEIAAITAWYKSLDGLQEDSALLELIEQCSADKAAREYFLSRALNDFHNHKAGRTHE